MESPLGPVFKTADELYNYYAELFLTSTSSDLRRGIGRSIILRLHLPIDNFLSLRRYTVRSHSSILMRPISSALWLHYHKFITEVELCTLFKMIMSSQEDKVVAVSIMESKLSKV